MTSSIDELSDLAKQALDRSKRLRKTAECFYICPRAGQRLNRVFSKQSNRMCVRRSPNNEQVTRASFE